MRFVLRAESVAADPVEGFPRSHASTTSFEADNVAEILHGFEMFLAGLGFPVEYDSLRHDDPPSGD